jgi:hypothetical protein
VIEGAWDVAARLAKRTTLARVRLEATHVYKQRGTFGEVLTRLENQVLAALGEPVRLVSGEAWLARENAAWRGLARLEKGVLVVPRAPGESLTERLVRLGDRPIEATRSFEAALTSLHALHARGLTHGDATADNVVVSDDGASAVWIDFEQEHLGDAAAARDDDLATVVLSAFTCVSGVVRGALVHALSSRPCASHERALEATRAFCSRHPRLPFLMRARLDGRSKGYRALRVSHFASSGRETAPGS